MLTQTAELGIQIMLYLALHGGSEPVPPRRIAGPSGASPTYAAKVTSLLVKAGLLRAQRGAHGGVILARSPVDITLLEVVEACQGVILADYCQPHDNLKQVCGYHHAMHDLHEALTGVLRRWTLADIAKRPCPQEALRGKVDCKLQWLEKVQQE